VQILVPCSAHFVGSSPAAKERTQQVFPRQFWLAHGTAAQELLLTKATGDWGSNA